MPDRMELHSRLERYLGAIETALVAPQEAMLDRSLSKGRQTGGWGYAENGSAEMGREMKDMSDWSLSCLHRFTVRWIRALSVALFVGLPVLESRADVPEPLDLPAEVRAMPIADAHLHYKWNQAEVTSPQEAAAALRANNVQLAVVTGTPAARVLELYEAAPEIVVPIFGAYRQGGDWFGWQGRASLVDEARDALENGPYRGIGELHLIGGFAMRWNRSDVLRALLALTAEHDVPMLIHTEFSRAEPTLSICEANPKNRIVLAHAGAALPPAEVRRVLDACPNVWMDLSARDPWRFVRFPISGEEGRLLPEWEALVVEYPDRFLAGSDAVWPVDRLDAWDRADTGWEHIGAFLDFHRRWASFLPEEVQRKVLLENAVALFRPAGSKSGVSPPTNRITD
ncbi:MAG: amidohydrolase family protein [Thiohalocapsa sp.]